MEYGDVFALFILVSFSKQLITIRGVWASIGFEIRNLHAFALFLGSV